MFKNIYKKNWKQKMMTWLLIWLNVNVATLNVMFQLLVRERERERERERVMLKDKIHAMLDFQICIYILTVEGFIERLNNAPIF